MARSGLLLLRLATAAVAALLFRVGSAQDIPLSPTEHAVSD